MRIKCWYHLQTILMYFFSLFLSDSSEVAHADFAVEALLPSELGAFYRYHGSLTTPPCNEVVEWVLFEEPLKISSAQVGTFLMVEINQ